MGEKNKNTNHPNEEKNKDLDYSFNDESFLERLRQENVMPDGMISEIDETDFINLLLAEKSAVKPFIVDKKNKDLAP
ncbi:hypothetical protein FQB35_12725 [Crassaminicella thermophila]|uniref:Uncharacterized protein n=1 Tax=Crassaminicella thermophila TaxID=2599308 RepID=A0A5C0SF90_CRATE|nr:hypothetical protein [Crassaminicella thermophila]QEK13113.1 hypothetical protein FQB35_12725 [Crassaminicella thermophila]